MLKSERSFLRNIKKQRWYQSLTFWAPHPENTLHISRHLLQETKRAALQHRKNIHDYQISNIKKQLLRTELDTLAQEHHNRTKDIFENLDTLEKLADKIGLTNNTKKNQPDSQNYAVPSAININNKTYEITIVQHMW